MNADGASLQRPLAHETALAAIVRRLVDVAAAFGHEDAMFCGLAMLDLARAQHALADDDPRSAQHALRKAADRLDWIAVERDRNAERLKRLPDPAQLAELEQLARDADTVRRGL